MTSSGPITTAACTSAAASAGATATSRTGFHIEFQPDDLFRGVHPVMLIDRSGAGDATANKQEEIVIKHMLNRAGGIPGTYPDICRVIAPRSAHTGPANSFPATRTSSSRPPSRTAATAPMFEMELIYYPTTANAGRLQESAARRRGRHGHHRPGRRQGDLPLQFHDQEPPGRR